MKKHFIIIFFISISILLYSQENKIKPIFSFSGSQGFSSIADSGKAKNLNLEHGGFGSIEIPISFYTLGIWLEDSLIFDFADMQNNNTLKKMINNSLSFGIDNTFFFKNKIYTGLNIYLNYVLPFNQYKIDDYSPNDDKQYLVINPLLKVGGMYYFGFDWEIEQDLPVKIIFASDASSFRPSTTLSLNYELFRNFGPRNFTISFITNDSLSFSLSLVNLVLAERGEENEDEDEDDGGGNVTLQANSLSNSVNIGLSFNFYGVSILAGFQKNIAYNISSRLISSAETGFTTGLSYTKNLFTYSIGYTGTMRHTSDYDKWISTFNISWSVDISSINITNPKNKKNTDTD